MSQYSKHFPPSINETFLFAQSFHHAMSSTNQLCLNLLKIYILFFFFKTLKLKNDSKLFFSFIIINAQNKLLMSLSKLSHSFFVSNQNFQLLSLIHVLCRVASPSFCCQESARGGQESERAFLYLFVKKKTSTPSLSSHPTTLNYTAAIEPCGGVVMLVIIVLAMLLWKGRNCHKNVDLIRESFAFNKAQKLSRRWR